MDFKELEDYFYVKFGNRYDRPVLFFSPGRVNLIGEHTDYNGGYVFPCALNYGTYLLIRKSVGSRISFSTRNFDHDDSVGYSGLFTNTGKRWINYPLGVMNEFIKRGIELGGMELLYYGDVPNGAGLSSSASIEMVTAVALNDLLGAGLSMTEMVKMSQRAENEFVGMNCGIMDQFAVGFGIKDHAIFLNCDNLNYENVPVKLHDCSLVITNTNKRRGLTDSKYNERRAECDRAVELLQHYKPLRNLSEISPEESEILDKYINDPVILRRARHVVSENRRVLEAVKVLKDNRIDRFGELMNLSHDSLRNDYEVTGTELDALVYEARKLKGVIGSRMTGAGFGGCTVSIVSNEFLEQFRYDLSKAYTNITGLFPDFYQPLIGNGAGKLDL